MMERQSANALVTGGGTGIGYGCAEALVAQGALVTIAGRREDVLKKAAEALGGETDYVVCDATEEDQVSAAVTKAARGGALDILVANAGTGFPAAIKQATAEHWDFSYRLNVVGTAFCIKHAALSMTGRGGAITCISSTSAVKVQPWMASYNVAKAGLEMLVRCAAIELGQDNIRVNCVQPGYTLSEKMAGATPPTLDRKLRASTPLGIPGKPRDIGEMVAFLSSDRASWITGQIIGVDGGLNIASLPSMAEIAAHLHGEETVRAFALREYVFQTDQEPGA